MDTKLKNNHKLRICVTVLAILLLTIITMCFFPWIGNMAEEKLEENAAHTESAQALDTGLLENLYAGSYVLYMEMMQQEEEITAAELFLKTSYTRTDEAAVNEAEDLKAYVNGMMEEHMGMFENYRAEIDYCVAFGEDTFKNTSQPLEELFSGAGEKTIAQFNEHYSAYFQMSFDENGVLTVEPLFGEHVDADVLIKTFGQLGRENSVWRDFEVNYDRVHYSLDNPKNIRIIYAIPRMSPYQLAMADYENDADYWTVVWAYGTTGGDLLYFAALVVLTALVFVMTSKKIWGYEIDMHRPGKWYLMEAALVGIIFSLCMSDSFVAQIYAWKLKMDGSPLLIANAAAVIGKSIESGVLLFFLYSIWYLSVRFLRPVAALGIRTYIREYSFFYQIFPWLKKQWRKLKDEAEHIDFSQKSVKTLGKIVVLNFAVLALISAMWFFGIFALAVYSVVLFVILHNYYRKAQFGYEALQRGIKRIAEGDLDTEITEDLGIFEPFKGELAKVRTGFKKAVEEEVKSQRMKTELITNVSHDLKTPLTAITTYVELLKKEDITEEERRSYIDILERKSLRLKVLVEDLFEVSKATSNTIQIELMDVDVIRLMRQVGVEHKERFAELGLDLRWNVPEEKVILALDNQKTYRIFENLFVNIQKYAMQNSRVYIDVWKENGQVHITVKNMSAMELNIRPEELTERFVRGDVSRNTEGSGLGLAIAKSFTEAQGGNFALEVDGDLFKVKIDWKDVQVGTASE